MRWWSRSVEQLRAALRRMFSVVKRPSRQARQQAEFETARREFHRQRERLEAKFFELSSNSGKPRGLRWTEIDFEDDVTYARQRSTGQLCAFVSVTIGFEAIEGGTMEGVEAVGNLRAATAVFGLVNGRWHTEGRSLFNLTPSEAIAHYHDNLEMVQHEAARS
ncbi:MAG: hypothetical protein JSS27_16160 [Planctomycetes bacterium]|nr:hypothetical protein [Planctomycetota bacterium]